MIRLGSSYEHEVDPRVAAVRLAQGDNGQLRRAYARRHDLAVEPLISHRDVTTIMAVLGDIRADVAAIRGLLEEDDGTEEEGDPEADA